MDEAQKKAELAQRLERFPLLRVLVFDRWFRLALILLILALLAGTALMLPVWNTSPAHIPRVNRIKLLDFVQAGLFKRRAREAEQEGRWEDALTAWRTAMLNNRADLEANRGLLQSLRDRPDAKPQYTVLGLITAGQLLQHSQTNLQDVALAAEFDEKYRLSDLALQRLAPWREEFTPRHEAAWARTLFGAGRVEEFEAAQEAGRVAFDADPLTALYRDAWLGGWGSVDKGVDARARLEAAAAKPETAATAARLLLFVAAQRRDAASYGRWLAELEKLASDGIAQHALHWRLLAASGQLDKARELAAAFTRQPELAMDALRVAEALEVLQLTDEALNYLAQVSPRFVNNPEMWIGYASLLLRHQKWEELRRIALMMRQVSASQDPLTAFSHYLEARADLGRGRTIPAREALKRLESTAVHLTPSLALAVAAGLVDAGQPTLAQQILLPHAETLAFLPEYWSQRFRAAYALREVAGMDTASQKLLELQPRNPLWKNNRAAVLLITRADPTEALSLTLQVMNSQPGATAARINHALSLLQNQRTDEAAGLLATITPARLAEAEAAAFHVARAEMLAQRREIAAALREARLVDPAQLMPPQAEWLRGLVAKLEGRVPKG
ncbi:MAG: hypothetical protein ACKVYV_16255 [Limisphaerales bacterium]